MRIDLPPIKPRALAVRTIPDASDDLARAFGLPGGRRALGIITATSDDALYAALDQGTKASPAEVVYAKSFYAGAGYPSGPLSGECIGVYAARDPAEVDAALDACLAYLENEAWFYAAVTAEEPDRPVAFFPHVIASVGRYLAPLADIAVGSPLAYLIAPPLESIVGLDAACKAGRVQIAKWFGPPSETNFGGGYLSGDLPACEAAARAFAAAIVDVCAAPLARRSSRGAGESMARTPPSAANGGASPGRFRALATGETFAEKPDHLTHLVDDASLVPKTHPRIVARGKLDLLQSALLDAQVAADADGARALVGELGEVLELARALVGAEVTGREVPPPKLFGMDSDAIRDATHHTHELYGVPFMYPDVRQGPVVAKLSLARGIAREAELAMLAAFPPARGAVTAPPARADLAHALNRISSALYLCACRYVAGLYPGSRRPLGPIRGWKPPAKPESEKDVSAALSPEKQARLAKQYDDEIAPAYAARFGAMLLRQVRPTPGARIVEIGCATGQLTRELARRFDGKSRISAFDESEAFVTEARGKTDGVEGLRASTTFRVAEPRDLPADDESADLAVSNLAVADAADPGAAAGEMMRALAPGGTAVITAPLRGTWAEFLDLFRDVLRESGKRERLAALDAYVASLPDARRVVTWLEQAGFTDAGVEVERWEILFKSSREFLFAPLVELGPLPQWKRLAGAGDDMQDAFFFTKEAIDAYFKGRPFAVSVVAAVAWGRKRR